MYRYGIGLWFILVIVFLTASWIVAFTFALLLSIIITMVATRSVIDEFADY